MSGYIPQKGFCVQPCWPQIKCQSFQNQFYNEDSALFAVSAAGRVEPNDFADGALAVQLNKSGPRYDPKLWC